MTKEIGRENVLILHPALEVRDDLAVVSFRRKTIKDSKVIDEVIHLISTEGRISVTNSSLSRINDVSIIFEDKILPIDNVHIGDLIDWASHAESPNAAIIYNEIKSILQQYLELPMPSYGLIAAWIIGTYFYRAFHSYPYLSFLGPKETGKSNTLECLNYLCFNSVKTRPSLPALSDTADSLRGTILIDQATNLNDDLREILVDGYKNGGGRRRIVDISSKGRKTIEFDSYCPKVFASIEPLADDLADRTFTINMAPATRAYPCPSASKRDWKQLRTDIIKLLLVKYQEVCRLTDEMSDDEGYRFGELWLPMRVILNMVEADEEEIADIKSYCEKQFSQVRYELGDWDYELVSIVSEADNDELSAEDLLRELHLRIEEGIDGHKPQKQWLGKAMKRFGLIERKTGGKHSRTVYILNREQARKLLGIVGEVGGSASDDYPALGLATDGDSGEVIENIYS